MCGISSVLGYNSCIKSLLVTLSQLERGTEGCGITYVKDHRINVIKEPCHPSTFFSKYIEDLLRLKDEGIKISIAHNRQPSKGEVCYVNTHPFISCDGSFALVHNGTSFNDHYREYVFSKGHKVEGETDSEIILHMLEEDIKTYGSLEKALVSSELNYLNGVILILTKDNVVYGLRKGYYSYHVALCEDEIITGSSYSAVKRIAFKAKDIITIKNHEVFKMYYLKDKPVFEIIKKGKEKEDMDMDLSCYWVWDEDFLKRKKKIFFSRFKEIFFKK